MARQVSLLHRQHEVLQSIAAGIGSCNFPRTFSMILNSSSSGSMKWIPRNLLVLSNYGFSIAHFCFFTFFCIRHMFRHFWPYIVGPWGRLFSRQSSHRTMCIRQVASHSKQWILWNMSVHPIILLLHPHPTSHDKVVPAVLVTLMYFKGRGKILQSACHTTMSLEVVRKSIRLIHLEDYIVLLLGQGDPGKQWMFLEPDLLQIIWLFYLRMWKNFSPFIGVKTSSALSLLACSDASISSNSSMSATIMFPFQFFHPHTRHYRGTGDTSGLVWCSLDESFAEMEWYSTIAPSGITGRSKGIPNRLSYGVFPTDNRSWLFRR